jgi:hypothetical protein
MSLITDLWNCSMPKSLPLRPENPAPFTFEESAGKCPVCFFVLGPKGKSNHRVVVDEFIQLCRDVPEQGDLLPTRRGARYRVKLDHGEKASPKPRYGFARDARGELFSLAAFFLCPEDSAGDDALGAL